MSTSSCSSSFNLILKFDFGPTRLLYRIKYFFKPPIAVQINKAHVFTHLSYDVHRLWKLFATFSCFGTRKFWICKNLCVSIVTSVCLCVCLSGMPPSAVTVKSLSTRGVYYILLFLIVWWLIEYSKIRVGTCAWCWYFLCYFPNSIRVVSIRKRCRPTVFKLQKSFWRLILCAQGGWI